ncbi:hypothetical protein BDR03DRAFT_945513 [Suillus americanus]|nr:hypothetical protein BDR03DRAFT_945513 [Suillus americanus]
MYGHRPTAPAHHRHSRLPSTRAMLCPSSPSCKLPVPARHNAACCSCRGLPGPPQNFDVKTAHVNSHCNRLHHGIIIPVPGVPTGA